MKLLTKELIEKFPSIGANDNKKIEEIEIIAKFFDPTGVFIWYPTEFDGEDIFFGFVRGLFNEFGSFSLGELEHLKGSYGLGIERDLNFGKHTLAEVIEKRL